MESNNKKEIYVNIILKDGSMLHKAILFKNKQLKRGELLISYDTKEEVEQVLNNNKERNIVFSTNHVQGMISGSCVIESYSIVD